MMWVASREAAVASGGGWKAIDGGVEHVVALVGHGQARGGGVVARIKRRRRGLVAAGHGSED
eukprot:518305-Prymnesium_polylepis.1